MSFKWVRMHKYEENIEREINDCVIEQVCEHYKISDTNELTQEQIKELELFATENKYSILAQGFRYVIDEWENNNETEIQ
jgi:hypothetical protein